MNKIYVVVELQKRNCEIKSKWFIIQNNKLKDVTLPIYGDVDQYNKNRKGYQTSIPYDYVYQFTTDYIIYSHGCGWTHYLQDNNLKDVIATFEVDSLDVWTTNDLTMYSNVQSWKKSLETALIERKVLSV